MKVVGIIAEYNPFHNGHAYQIKKVKEELNADYVVVAMSGNFVQRGTPALIDKYARANMALVSGADLIIELPVLWATASAEYFAMAGVTLFEKMGCVNNICFGAETDDLTTLSMLADILIEEPNAYREVLSSYLKEGFSFPTARSKALCDYLMQSNLQSDTAMISSILNEPNNILAIEYLKALKRRNSAIVPHIIKRKGAGYHEESILPSEDCTPSMPTASATAIRKGLFEHLEASLRTRITSVPPHLENTMPEDVLAILNEYLTNSTLIFPNDFSPTLCYKLLSANTEDLAKIGDCNADLANRILKNRSGLIKFEQFCELCKSKDVTYTRLSRILTHLFLEIKEEDYSFGKALDYIPYLRIIGFNKAASPLLKELKKNAVVPVISKLANATALLEEDALTILKKDIFASDLYAHISAILTETPFVNEYTRNIVIIDS